VCEICRTDADSALETALRILEALQKAREAQAIAEEAITKAQGQISDIETSLDTVSNFLVFFRLAVGVVVAPFVA